MDCFSSSAGVFEVMFICIAGDGIDDNGMVGGLIGGSITDGSSSDAICGEDVVKMWESVADTGFSLESCWFDG